MSEEMPGPRRVCVLAAPSNLGLKPPAGGVEPGVREMAAALRREGLLERLGAVSAGGVEAPAYDATRDPVTSLRNATGIRSFSVDLAERVGELLDEGWFPLVLGGDCSIVLGSALALRRRGRFGLLFVDGHTDLLTGETSETGGVAGMAKTIPLDWCGIREDTPATVTSAIQGTQESKPLRRKESFTAWWMP